MATSRSSTGSMPRKSTPIPPLPTRSMTWYRPIWPGSLLVFTNPSLRTAGGHGERGRDVGENRFVPGELRRRRHAGQPEQIGSRGDRILAHAFGAADALPGVGHDDEPAAARFHELRLDV